MAINEEFGRQYFNALKKCLMTVEMSRKYEDLCSKYNDLRDKINEELKKRDSICSDAERLIDKETGELKDSIGVVVGNDTAILKKLDEFKILWLQKRSFADFGWRDDLKNSIDSVLAISEYSNMEKQIIAELGINDGQRYIYEAKKRIIEFEKTLGLDFFREEVLKMRDLFRIKTLISDTNNINLDGKDNLNTQKLSLSNADGEIFDCKKVAEMTYRGTVFIEIEFLKDLRVCPFNYYVLSTDNNTQLLTLVEDKALNKELDLIRDKL